MPKTEWKGAALLAPVPPALVSCGTLEAPNALAVAWTGILNSQPPKTYISVRPERYSYGLIKESGEFIINLPTAALVRAVDYCGVKSGRNGNKLAAARLTAEAVPGFAAPAIAESPLSLACRVADIVPLGTHDMFLADIVSVQVDEALIDANGRLRLAKAVRLCARRVFRAGAQNRRFRLFCKEEKEKAAVRQAPATEITDREAKQGRAAAAPSNRVLCAKQRHFFRRP